MLLRILLTVQKGAFSNDFSHMVLADSFFV
jgi:hypothetical protein